MNDKVTPLSEVNVNVELRGRVFKIRPILDEDVNSIYVSWLNDPEVNKFLEVRHNKQNTQTIREYINQIRSRPGCEVFAICEISSGKHIGNIAITKFDTKNGVATYGLIVGDRYFLENSFAGGEATLLILQYIFSESSGISKIISGALFGNDKALRMMKALGFTNSNLRKTEFNEMELTKDQWIQVRSRFSTKS
jgi:ribosomal-protein-alanine N-acetyltransferase